MPPEDPEQADSEEAIEDEAKGQTYDEIHQTDAAVNMEDLDG